MSEFIDNKQPNVETNKEGSLMERAERVLSLDDFRYFEATLREKEPFDPKGLAMHTTNDYYFSQMLESGRISTSDNKEGIYGSEGASFGDGDFEESLTFQTLYDEQNTRSGDKKFDSQRYSDKVRDFITHFWETKPDETKAYLKERNAGNEVGTVDDAIRVAEKFKFKTEPKDLANDPERLSKLYGVTIVYDKAMIPDLNKDKTTGIQKDFELRSYRKGGVPIEDASMIFAPEAKIEEIKSMLKERGLEHIEVRPSEEMEVARMAKILSE